MRLAALCLIGRDSRCVDTVANSSDASSYDELCRGTAADWHRTDLNDDTDDHDASAKEDRLSAAEMIAKGQDEAGSKEAAHSVDGGNKAFVGA